jgi:hypothetical protein
MSRAFSVEIVSLVLRCLKIAAHTSLLALLLVGVLLATDDDGVDSDENRQDTSQRGLYNDKNKTSDRLGGLGHSKLLNEDQNANDRQHTNGLDGDVDPVTRLEGVRAGPEKYDEKHSLDNELTGGLGKSVTICSGNNTATSKHVDNGRDEDPPIALLVVFVEHAVLAPDLLVVVERIRPAFELLELVGDAPNFPGKECQDAGKSDKGHTSESFGGPRVSLFELVNTVKYPDTVEKEDQVSDRLCESPPVTLAEASETVSRMTLKSRMPTVMAAITIANTSKTVMKALPSGMVYSSTKPWMPLTM